MNTGAHEMEKEGGGGVFSQKRNKMCGLRKQLMYDQNSRRKNATQAKHNSNIILETQVRPQDNFG